MARALPLLLYGIPRSGTTPIYEVIASYLSAREGISGVGEIFNPRHHAIQETAQGLCSIPCARQAMPSPEEYRRHCLTHFELTRRYHGRCFFKLLALQASPDILSWLSRHYDWIFVERRDLFELTLSIVLSLATDTCYSLDGIHPQPASLSPEPGHFLQAERAFVEYRKMKARVKPRCVLVYEDMAVHGMARGKILESLGWKDPAPMLGQPHARQTIGDKLRFFREPEVLLKAYRRTFMQGEFPI